HPTLLYHKVRKSTSVKLKKFDKKIALYQGIERKYFNSTVKLPECGQLLSQFFKKLREAKKLRKKASHSPENSI
ncbi:hypothetical protein MMJ50_07035, partial [Enterococcus cecorum]|nr:hypothetical protein [Enterococcus cecorum]